MQLHSFEDTSTEDIIGHFKHVIHVNTSQRYIPCPVGNTPLLDYKHQSDWAVMRFLLWGSCRKGLHIASELSAAPFLIGLNIDLLQAGLKDSYVLEAYIMI
jgi:hypothetical protein